jgi:hypothetical protein
MAREDIGEDGSDRGTGSNSGRVRIVPMVIAALAALGLIAMLSPRTEVEIRDHPAPNVRESIPPGPIPATERRPTPTDR